MQTNKIFFTLCTIILSLTLSGCDWLHNRATRETVFDRIVNIPKEFVLNIPHLPPLCDVLPGIKRDLPTLRMANFITKKKGMEFHLF